MKISHLRLLSIVLIILIATTETTPNLSTQLSSPQTETFTSKNLTQKNQTSCYPQDIKSIQNITKIASIYFGDDVMGNIDYVRQKIEEQWHLYQWSVFIINNLSIGTNTSGLQFQANFLYHGCYYVASGINQYNFDYAYVIFGKYGDLRQVEFKGEDKGAQITQQLEKQAHQIVKQSVLKSQLLEDQASFIQLEMEKLTGLRWSVFIGKSKLGIYGNYYGFYSDKWMAYVQPYTRNKYYIYSF